MPTIREGVERAQTVVDDLRGDSEAFLDDVSEQMRERIAQQQEIREGLAAQVARLDVLIAHQQTQLEQLLAVRASFPAPDAMTIDLVDDLPDLADRNIPLTDRVHTALEAYGPLDRDGLVELFTDAGDRDADGHRVGAAISNLLEAARATKDDDGWVAAV